MERSRSLPLIIALKLGACFLVGLQKPSEIHEHSPTVDSPLCYVMLHNASQDIGVTELEQNILCSKSDREINPKVIQPKLQLLGSHV